MSNGESTARIPLRSRDGSVRAYAIVDFEDYERLSRHRWHLHCTGYARRTEYIVGTKSTARGESGKTRSYTLARDIMRAQPGEEVDHLNRDKLDNREAKVGLTNRRVNVLNTGMRKNNTTGYRGVSVERRPTPEVFVAKITAHRTTLYLGQFPTAEQAARAYDEAALRYHGEHAQLNFPE